MIYRAEQRQKIQSSADKLANILELGGQKTLIDRALTPPKRGTPSREEGLGRENTFLTFR